MARKFLLTGLLLLLVLAAGLIAAQAAKLQDPLRPVRYLAPAKTKAVSGPKDEVPEWHLSAVLLSENRAVAVVDGKPLQKGDEIDGYRVVKIENEQVVLKNKLRKIVLRRAGTGFKKVSSGKDVGIGSHP